MSNMPDRISIEFQPQNQITRVPAGMTLFNAANWIGLAIDSTCGGRGTCGKCKVRIQNGQADITIADRKVFSDEELSQGWRLSCRAEVFTDTVCEVPRMMGNPQAALMGMGRHIVLDPNVHKIYLELTPPELEDQRSDYTRIQAALAEFEIKTSLSVLRRLPILLRECHWKITAVVVGDELVAVEGGDTTERCYGLAFDIGTTTVVGMLLNLRNGMTEALTSTLNGQAPYGADVIARISFSTLEEDGLDLLQSKIIATLNGLIQDLLTTANVNPHEVYEALIAGNATMLHLLLGLTPEAIGVMPFIPVADEMLQVRAGELQLNILPQAQIHTLPHLGAYVGGDLVGGLLATGLAQETGIRLLVDVGTNGEIILGSVNRTVATAAPAGPAFEGAQIKCGMRASAGAIEGVRITSDGVELDVIGDAPPIGICGSGLLDAVAQMLMTGLVDLSGRFVSPEGLTPKLAERFITLEDGMRAFVLAWSEQPIFLTQRDIRELQFAKAAIASGIDVVMRELGVTPDDLEAIYLAGSFGSYINPRSAVTIGLVPPIPLDRIQAVGNTAGEGAKMALLSFRQRQVARSLPNIVEYHELSGRTDFNDSFIETLQFPTLD